MSRRSFRRSHQQDSESEETEDESRLIESEELQKEKDVENENSDSDLSQNDGSDDDGSFDDDPSNNLASDDDDDDAPTSVTFTQSKENALQKVKNAMKQIQDVKNQKKEKRRFLQEKYKEQKKRRLDVLSQSLLPEDVLAEISSQPKTPEAIKPPETQKQKDEDSVHDEDEGIDGDDDFSDNDDTEVEINQGFIPLKYDRFAGVTVATEKDLLKKTKSLSESALEFRNKALYGKRIPRISTKAKLLKDQKRKACFR